MDPTRKSTSTSGIRHQKEFRNNAFGQAIEEFLSEVERKGDTKNLFYLEVLSQLEKSSINNDTNWSLQCAEGLKAFVEEIAHKQKHESKTFGILQRLKPLFSGLSLYTRACDVAIQAGGAPACVIYGGARLVLDLASNFYECLDSVADILGDVGTLLQCYDRFADVYQASEPLQLLLVKSYKNILSFWRKASKLLSRKVYLTIPITFVKDIKEAWQKYRKELDSDRAKVLMFVNANEVDLRRERDLRDEDARNKSLWTQIAKWIKGHDADRDFDVRLNLGLNLDLQHAGTCSWLHEDPSFRSWYDAKSSRNAWYCAPPGAGKTVLSASLVKHLQEQGMVVVYFFCSFDDPMRRKSISILRSIALQLLTLLNSVPDKIIQLYDNEVRYHSLALDDRNQPLAIKLVTALLSEFPRIHIVVDGLDECCDRSDLTSMFLQMLPAKSYGIIKWFFTSRNDESLTQILQNSEAIEVCPSKEAVEHDIQLYFQNQLASLCEDPNSIDYWVAASGGNFLWSKLMLDVLKESDSVCEEDIEKELHKFPLGLTGCYLRCLQQLELKFESQRDLARKIFMILVIAKQPLHLSELSSALAVREGAENHSSKRVPPRNRIKQICGNLVLMDTTTSQDSSDPLLRFFHKSVHDFFSQDPEDLGIPSNLERYFIQKDKADFEVGEICLNYLSYKTYLTPVDLRAIANHDADNEHAFLKYATTFWFLHFHHGHHSPDLYHKICNFIQSPNFWTCVAVQCQTTPYLFSAYFGGDGYFNLGAPKHSELPQDGNVSFASPFPEWLAEYGQLGSAILRSFHSFIVEWHLALTNYPDAVNHCIMKEKCSSNFPSRQKLESKNGQRFCADSLFALKDSNGKSIADKNPFLNNIVEAIKNSKPGSPLVISQANSSPNCFVSESEWPRTSNIWRLEKEDRYHEWNADLRTLHMKCSGGAAEKEYHAPANLEALARGSKQDPDRLWTIVTTAIHKHTTYGDTIVIQCVLGTGSNLQDDNASDSGYGQSDDDDSDSSDSDDSDAESDPDSGYAVSDVNEPASVKDNIHCLVVLRHDAEPFWLPISAQGIPTLAFSSLLHPSQPIMIWSHSLHELTTLNCKTGSINKNLLPEPVDAELSLATVISKDFKFSADGRLLHYLLATFVEDGSETLCTISFSSFEFAGQSQDSVSLLRRSASQKLTYRFAGAIPKAARSIVLTYWSSKHVYVALPPLNCRPKVIRLKLPEDLESDTSTVAVFQTLKNPIYLPSTTLKQSVQMVYLENTLITGGPKPKKRDLLALGFNFYNTKGDFFSPGARQINDEPDLLTWTVSRKEGWRDWDLSLDERTEEMEERAQVYEKLRGSFVSQEQRFKVIVRSGLDWTRKAYLSCS